MHVVIWVPSLCLSVYRCTINWKHWPVAGQDNMLVYKHVQAVSVKWDGIFLSSTKEGGGHIHWARVSCCDAFAFYMTKLPFLIWKDGHGSWGRFSRISWLISEEYPEALSQSTKQTVLAWFDMTFWACVRSCNYGFIWDEGDRVHPLFWLGGPQWRSMSKDVQAWDVFVQQCR